MKRLVTLLFILSCASLLVANEHVSVTSDIQYEYHNHETFEVWYDVDKTFNSIREASRFFNFDNKKLSRYAKTGQPIIKKSGDFKGIKLHFVLI